jgi:hypothetical protein
MMLRLLIHHYIYLITVLPSRQEENAVKMYPSSCWFARARRSIGNSSCICVERAGLHFGLRETTESQSNLRHPSTPCTGLVGLYCLHTQDKELRKISSKFLPVHTTLLSR